MLLRMQHSDLPSIFSSRLHQQVIYRVMLST